MRAGCVQTAGAALADALEKWRVMMPTVTHIDRGT